MLTSIYKEGDSHTGSRFTMLLTSFLVAIDVYMVYIFHRLVTFHPSLDSSWIVPIYRPEYRPELDLVFYVVGILFVLIAGSVTYLFLRRSSNRLSQYLSDSGVGVAVRAMAAITVLLYYLFVAYPGMFQMIYRELILLLFIAVALVISVCFVFPKVFLPLLRYVLQMFDWVVVMLLSFLMVKILILLFLTQYLSTGQIVEAISESDYSYFHGITGIHVFLTACLLGLLFVLWTWPTKSLEHFIHSHTLPGIIVHSSVLLVILFLMTLVAPGRFATPSFLSTNYSAVMSPINDVLGGKTLLVNAYSQYGLLHIYVLSILFRLIPLTYTNFFWMNFIVTTGAFIIIYIFLRKWLGGIAWFGILLVFLHYYFAGAINILFTPSGTFVRWGWGMILLLFLFYSLRHPSKTLIVSMIESLLVGMAFFWAFDQGIYAVGAYIVGRCIALFLSSGALRDRIKRLYIFTIEVGVSLGVTFSVLTLFTFVRSGQWPQWSMFTLAVNQYRSGIFMIPIPSIGPYIVIILIYGVVIAWVLHRLFMRLRNISQEYTVDLPLVGYLATLGLLQFLYYVGRSSDGNLHVVLIPSILLFCWMLVATKRWVSTQRISWQFIINYRLALGLSAFMFLLFSILTAITLDNVVNTFSYRLSLLNYSIDTMRNEEPYKASLEDINRYLRKKIRSERIITLVSNRDDYFLINTSSINRINSNLLDTLNTMDQLTTLGRQLRMTDSDIIFVDHNQTFNVEYLTSFIRERYRPAERVGYLDIWIRREQSML